MGKAKKVLYAITGGFALLVATCVWHLGREMASVDPSNLAPATAAPQASAKDSTKTPTPSQGRMITAAEVGAAWPLTVKQGHLECRDGLVVFTAPDGLVYGVSPKAMNAHGYRTIFELADHRFKDSLAGKSSAAGDAMSLEPLIKAGKSLCQ